MNREPALSAPARLVIERAGHVVLQDLGRPGHAHLGIAPNGAADQRSARTANILVGNADTAPLLEITASEVEFTVPADLLLSTTGAVGATTVDGRTQPAWQTLPVFRGNRVRIIVDPHGYRCYVAFSARIDAATVLGSVAPDHLLSAGRQLFAGDALILRVRTTPQWRHWQPALFRFGPAHSAPARTVRVDAVPGPDLGRILDGFGALSAGYRVSGRSDHIGLRLSGPAIAQAVAGEILSRGVPVGAIETPPGGGIIVLLRGRMVTAGYPVMGVVTTEALDRLGQAGPGTTVFVDPCSRREAHERLRAREADLNRLAGRVGAAFRAAGLGGLLETGHRASA